ncbi:MAG: hypothetical protein AB7F43_09895 [Bacteriovoracia bacterium]
MNKYSKKVVISGVLMVFASLRGYAEYAPSHIKVPTLKPTISEEKKQIVEDAKAKVKERRQRQKQLAASKKEEKSEKKITKNAPPVKPSCANELNQLYLSAIYKDEVTAQEKRVYVGKKENTKHAIGLIATLSEGGSEPATCDQHCKITRFERFKSDLNPALLEMHCSRAGMQKIKAKTLAAVPPEKVLIRWKRNTQNVPGTEGVVDGAVSAVRKPRPLFETSIQVGQGADRKQTPARVEVNRYSTETEKKPEQKSKDKKSFVVPKQKAQQSARLETHVRKQPITKSENKK